MRRDIHTDTGKFGEHDDIQLLLFSNAVCTAVYATHIPCLLLSQVGAAHIAAAVVYIGETRNEGT